MFVQHELCCVLGVCEPLGGGVGGGGGAGGGGGGGCQTSRKTSVCEIIHISSQDHPYDTHMSSIAHPESRPSKEDLPTEQCALTCNMPW